MTTSPDHSKKERSAMVINPEVEFRGYVNTPVDFTRVKMTDDFWAPRQRVVQRVSVPWAASRLDASPDASPQDAPRVTEGSHVRYGDYEAIKFVETLAVVARATHDDELAATAAQWGRRFTADQEESGYLPHLYPAGRLYGRWHIDWWSHELYVIGHFLDAAMAVSDATGSDDILTVALRAVENVATELMDPNIPYGVGCSGIEPALMRLYGRTGNQRVLDLCQWLVDQRGRVDGRVGLGPYAQDHLPVERQRTIEGHAVRAAFLFAGVAGLVGVTGDAKYLETLRSVWSDMVEHKSYVHGATGSRRANNEGYLTEPDVLPRDDCYGESCSVYANFEWAHEMFRLTGESTYLDDAERMLLNAFPASLSLDGDTYYYENPVEQTSATVRSDWHPVPCCPPNILKLTAKIGGFFYAATNNDVWVKHYGASEVSLPNGTRITQEGNYPWEGKVALVVDPGSVKGFRIQLRVPRWANRTAIRLNGTALHAKPSGGWISIDREWRVGDRIELDLPMDIRRVRMRDEVDGYRGMVAIERGPVVYCLEEQDLRATLELAILPDDASIVAEFRPDFLGGVTVLHTTMYRRDGLMYRRDPAKNESGPREGGAAMLVPYAVWANRRPGAMRIWHPTVEEPLAFSDSPPEPGRAARFSNPGLT